MKTIKVGPSHSEDCDCQAEDCPSSGGVFYVMATRRKEEFEVAGPFESAYPALDLMPQAWFYFWKLNPRNSYRWEIAKYYGNPPFPPGLLNERLGVETSSDLGRRIHVGGSR